MKRRAKSFSNAASLLAVAGASLFASGGAHAQTAQDGDIYVTKGTVQIDQRDAATSIHMVDPILSLAAAGTYSGAISLEVGTPASADPTIFQNTSGGLVILSGAITTGSGLNILSQPIDPVQFVTFDTGQFELTNTGNAWTGPTQINGGASLFGATDTISGGSIINNGTLAYSSLAAAGSASQNISGNGAINITAPGKVSLAGAITTSGALTINAPSGQLDLLGSRSGGNQQQVLMQGAAATLKVGSGALVTGGNYLGVRINGADNTVTNLGSITNAAPGDAAAWGAAIAVAATSGTTTINNGDGTATGLIQGSNAAINHLGSGGVVATGALVVNNKAGSTIKANSYNAIENQNGAGSLTVNNAAGGLIQGGSAGYGIYFGTSAGSLSVTNAGTIKGTVGGIFTARGGSITNQAGGTISGQRGIHNNSGTDLLTVDNTGTITANTTGGFASVYSAGALTVTNRTGGLIQATGGAYGLRSGGFLDLTNESGATVTSTGFGIVSFGGATITNNAGATISSTGTGAAIHAQGAAAFSLTNYGTIKNANSGHNGVNIQSTITSATIVNHAGGLISGGLDGIFTAVTTTIDNYGTITGVGNNGVSLYKGGTLTNHAGGVINATVIPGGWGAFIYNAYGEIHNAGTINADSGIVLGYGGALADNSGTINATDVGILGYNTYVVADNSGTIDAANFGVLSAAGGSTVTNSGSLTATAASGIGIKLVGNGNTVLNKAGGTITGGSAGTAILLTGSGNTVTTEAGSTVNGVIDNTAATAGSIFNLGGTHNGAVNAGSGNDTVTVLTSAVLNGAVDGGAGTDALLLDGSGNLTLTNTFANFESLTKNGTGTVTLGFTDANVGPVTINAGRLAVSGGNALADATAVTVNTGGTFALGADETIGALSGSGAVDLVSYTLSTNSDGSSSTFNGVIGGSGGLTKLGAGTLTLGGTNTFSGATTLSEGTLALAGAGSLGSSAARLAAGTTLDIAGITGGSTTLGSLAGTGTVQLSGKGLIVGGDNSSTTFAGLLAGNTAAGLVFAGDWAVSDGPDWWNSPISYSGQSAAAMLFGGKPSDYAISTQGSDSALIDHKAWLDGYGDMTYLFTPASESFSVGIGPDNLYSSWGAFSAYVRDHQSPGTGPRNYAFRILADTSNLTKTGTGTLTLTNANTYAGGTTVLGGTLRLDNVAAAGTGAIHLVDPTLAFGVSGTFANAISLDVADPASASPSNTSNDPNVLRAESGVTATLSGVIATGSGTNAAGYAIGANQQVEIAGPGVIELTNTANSWAGKTTIDVGSTLKGTTATISGGSITDNGTLIYAQDTSGSVAKAISGSGLVRIEGTSNANTITFSGTNTVAGGFTSTNPRLVFSGSNTTTAVAATMNGANAFLDVLSGGSLTSNSGQGVIFAQGNAQLGNAGTIRSNLIGGAAAWLKGGGTVTNSGTMSIGSASGNGITSNLGALTVTNQAGGTISSGSLTGFGIQSSAGLSLNNSGTILGASRAVWQSNAAVLTSVTNNAGAEIRTTVSGNGRYAVYGAGQGTLDNSGLISSVYLSGSFTPAVLFFGAGSSIINRSGAVISGSRGVELEGGGTIENFGTISGLYDNAMTLFGGGSMTNQASGTLNAKAVAGTWGMFAGQTVGTNAVTTSTLINRGLIDAGAGIVVNLSNATITNSGTILAMDAGIMSIDGPAFLAENSGSITSSISGVRGATGFTLTNTATGSIHGTTYGVENANGAVTIDNQGSITGGTAAILLAGSTAASVTLGAASNTQGGIYLGGGNDGLTIEGGASVTGAIDGGAGSDTLVVQGSGDLTLAGALTNFEALTMNGTGTLALSGNNGNIATVTLNAGTTTVAGGNALGNASSVAVNSAGKLTLLADEVIGALSGTGRVDLGSHFLGTNADGSSSTFAGIMSGTGAFTKLGAGTLTLSGANTFTGDALVSAGTLAWGASNVLADASTLTVASGAIADIGARADRIRLFFLNGTLNGTGTLSAEQHVLNGAVVIANLAGVAPSLPVSTPTSAQTVQQPSQGSAPILRPVGGIGAGNSAAIASLDPTAPAAEPAVLDLSNFGQLVSASAPAALEPLTLAPEATTLPTAPAGSLFQVGGTSLLNGTANVANIYVQSGTLRLGAAERIANAAQLNISSGATFDLAGYNETLATLSGTGLLSLGAGNLTLGGTNADFGFGGTISGSGDLFKTGTGTFTLLGDHTMTGKIIADAGNLIFVGSSHGGLSVAGAQVAGAGVFGGNLALSSGSLAPGVTGSPLGGFEFASLNSTGGALAIDFNGASGHWQSDFINVTGAASLAGTTLAPTSLSASSDYATLQRYRILQSGSLTGTFANGASLTQLAGSSDLYWRLRYDLSPNSVLLEVRRKIDFAGGLPGGGTNNQIAVGGALNGAQLSGSDPWINALYEVSRLTGADRAAALDSIGGESIGNLSGTVAWQSNLYTQLVRDRMTNGGGSSGSLDAVAAMLGKPGASATLRAAQPVLGAAGPDQNSGSGVQAWIRGYGASGKIDATTGTGAVNTFAAGVALGLELQSDDFTAGVAGSVSEVDARLAARLSHAEGTMYQGGAYLGYDSGTLFANAVASYFSGKLASRRQVMLGSVPVGEAAGTARTHGYAMGISLGTRVPLGGKFILSPRISGEMVDVTRDAFSETGAGVFSLDVARDRRTTYAGIGEMRLSWRNEDARGGAIEPYLSAGVRFNGGDLDGTAAMRFAGAAAGTGAFTIEGARLAKTALVLGAGIHAEPSDSVKLGVDLDGTIASGQREGKASLYVKFAF